MGKETIWRIQEGDFKGVIRDKFPRLTEEQTKVILDQAQRRFSIDDWTFNVKCFVEEILQELEHS